MASKKQQKAGFPLPDPIDGWPLLDICLKIPDAPEYRRAFLGHINQLGQWFMWEKSYLPGDTRAKEAAELWRRVLFDYLDMGCDMCCDDPPALLRYNADNELERSTDGGATWTAAPGYDPRNNAPQYPPLPGDDGDDKKCQAATNIRQHTKEQADKLAADAGAWGGISDMIAALLAILFFIGVFGTLGAATPLLVAFAGAILYAGQAAFDAAMTTDVYDTFKCIVYCHIEDDGSFTDDDLAAIISDIKVQLTGIAVDFLVHTVTVLGKIGLANMGKTASGTTGDCSACDCSDVCPVEWTFYGVTDVVQDPDNENIWHMKAVGNPTHIAFSSGDLTMGCYFAGPLGTFSYAPVGSDHNVDGTNPAHTPIWNADFGGDLGAGAGGDVTFTFSKFLIP